MDKLKYIKIENEDGTLSDNIPIGADASNIDTADGKSNLKADLSSINVELNKKEIKINNLENKVNALSNGSPIAADGVEQMVDHNKIYINIQDGYWYYYNGTNWQQGNIYQSMYIGNNQIQNYMLRTKDIYAENLKFMRSILPFANQVVNAKLSGYNTSTFLLDFDYNSNDFITFIFNESDLQNLGEIRFSFNNSVIYHNK